MGWYWMPNSIRKCSLHSCWWTDGERVEDELTIVPIKLKNILLFNNFRKPEKQHQIVIPSRTQIHRFASIKSYQGSAQKKMWNEMKWRKSRLMKKKILQWIKSEKKTVWWTYLKPGISFCHRMFSTIQMVQHRRKNNINKCHTYRFFPRKTKKDI